MLGVDTGSSVIGSAVANEQGQVLYLSEVSVRNDIAATMKARARYRRDRRNRKTRYRKARWLNRRNSIKQAGSLPPCAVKLMHTCEKSAMCSPCYPLSAWC